MSCNIVSSFVPADECSKKGCEINNIDATYHQITPNHKNSNATSEDQALVTNSKFEQKIEKITAPFTNLRSGYDWTPVCTNPQKERILPPACDWPTDIKYTNEDPVVNFNYLKAVDSSSSHPTNSSIINKFNQLEEELMISTTAASIPAVQSNQTAFRVGPRLVRRASAFDLALSPLYQYHPSTSELNTNSKENIFSGFPSFIPKEGNSIPPPLNLLFSSNSKTTLTSDHQNQHWPYQAYQSYQSNFLHSLASPKSPELDPGGYLATGTLRHCLSPGALYSQCSCYDANHKCTPSDQENVFHPEKNEIKLENERNKTEFGCERNEARFEKSSFEPNAKEAIAAAWSSLLEGTIIGVKRDPTHHQQQQILSQKPHSLWEMKPPVSSSTIFPSLNSLKNSLPSTNVPSDNFFSASKMSFLSTSLTQKVALVPLDKLIIVTFKNGRSEMFSFPLPQNSNRDNYAPSLLDYVIVEGDRGIDLGVISGAVSQSWVHFLIRRWGDHPSSTSNRLSIFESDKSSEDMFASWDMVSSITGTSIFGNGISSAGGNNLPMSNDRMHFSTPKDLMAKRRILRLATKEEIRDWHAQRQEEVMAVLRCAIVVRSHRLPMTIVDAEYQYDRAKLTFYYVSSLGRVDFREMVRELFKIYKARIWMCSVDDEEDSSFEEVDTRTSNSLLSAPRVPFNIHL